MAPNELEDASVDRVPAVQIVSRPPDQFLNSDLWSVA